ncbi:glycosyltransferase family 4 protein [Vibrio parahaemolyticus]|nr:glycosyltransferase family 4 protein [Vibrio parahaemolyticus]EIA1766904.1 glycosyltransferase family 4 protein [Vibrio parahaemolyticus]
MKIKFLLGDVTSKGGIERVTIELAKSLGNKHDVEIISLYKQYEEPSFNTQKVTVSYLTNNFEKSMYNRKLSPILGALFDFYYIFKKSLLLKYSDTFEGADIIVASDIKSALLVKLTSLFTKSKVITIEHFEYDVPNTILKLLRRLIYPFLDTVVIQTNEDYLKYYWLDNEKIKVIPNIVSVPNVRPEKLNKQNTVLAVGRLTYQKGFDLLIEAWSLLGAKTNGWTLKIQGDGEEKVSLEEMISTRKLNNVVLEPFSDEIFDSYYSSKIFVLSSRFEGLGMVLIEALYCQLPSVSFDCPAGPKTIIDNDVNGILVKTGDVISLSKALERLISDEQLREKFSNVARESVSRYGVVHITGEWNKLLRELK